MTTTDERPPTCVFHPGRETRLRCSRCGRPACPDCLVHAAVGMQCRDCVAGREPSDSRVRNTLRARGGSRLRDRPSSQYRPGMLFYAIVAAFLLTCVLTLMVDDRSALTSVLMSGTPPVTARIPAFCLVVVGGILSVMLHEWAHAIVAYRGGDTGVVDKGYLTLDPRHYADPMLSIGLPVLFLFLGGLPLPGGAVWIDRGRLRGRAWRSAVSLAGPATNLLLGIVLLLVVGSGLFGEQYALTGALTFLAYIQFGLVILNLLPVPGLDGYGVIEPFLPYGIRSMLAPLYMVFPLLLMVLLFSGVLGPIWDGASWLADLFGASDFNLAFGSSLARPEVRAW